MARVLKKIFGIYSGEGKRALHFSLLAFIWSFGISISETLSISLLVDKIGAHMIPLTNVFTAIGMIASSCLFLYLLKRFPPHKILLSVIVSGVVFYTAAFPLLLSQVGAWFWIVLQMMTYIFVAGLIACYWSFVDEHHDLQDAKRAYGIYNGSYFLGNVASGIVINRFLGSLGTHGLFIMTIGALIVAFFYTQYFAPKLSSIEEDADTSPISSRQSYTSFFQKIFKSPFVLTLIGMSLVVQLMRTTTEYSYMHSLSQFFNPANSTAASPITENSLAQFLGKCHAWISLGNIIFGMFFYRKAVRRVGLSNLLIIPPIFFLGLYGQWAMQNSLWITVGAILAVEFILFTLEDNNFNLLISAAPNKIRGSLRIINDSFFEPIGMLLSSLLLLSCQNFSREIGFGLAGLFFVAALFVRKYYPKSIINNLKENAVRFDRSLPDWLQKIGKKEKTGIRKNLIKSLERDKNPQIRQMAWKGLLAFNDHSLLENSLIPQLATFSVNEKIKLLNEIESHPFSEHPQVLNMINSWTSYTQHPSLVAKAKYYLAKLGLLHPDTVKEDVNSLDLTKKATAIISLKHAIENQSLPEAAQNLELATRETELLLQSDTIEEILMGLEITMKGSSQEFSPKLLELLEHNDLVIRQKASQALAAIADISLVKFAPLLIDYLKRTSDVKIRLNILDTLGNIGEIEYVKDMILSSTHFRPAEKRKAKAIIIAMGHDTIPILLDIINDMGISNTCRILACKILGEVSPSVLQEHIDEVVEKEVAQSYFYAYHGYNIAKEYPHDSLRALQKALESGYESTTRFIIHLLVAGGSFEDSDMLVHSLHSKNPKVNAQAVETLEKYCSSKLFRKIFPLIEVSPWEEKLEICHNAYGKQPQLTLPELLNRLSQSSSLFEKVLALQLKAKLRIPGWEEALKKIQLNSADENIHHLVSQLLESS